MLVQVIQLVCCLLSLTFAQLFPKPRPIDHPDSFHEVFHKQGKTASFASYAFKDAPYVRMAVFATSSQYIKKFENLFRSSLSGDFLEPDAKNELSLLVAGEDPFCANQEGGADKNLCGSFFYYEGSNGSRNEIHMLAGLLSLHLPALKPECMQLVFFESTSGDWMKGRLIPSHLTCYVHELLVYVNQKSGAEDNSYLLEQCHFRVVSDSLSALNDLSGSIFPTLNTLVAKGEVAMARLPVGSALLAHFYEELGRPEDWKYYQDWEAFKEKLLKEGPLPAEGRLRTKLFGKTRDFKAKPVLLYPRSVAKNGLPAHHDALSTKNHEQAITKVVQV